MKRLFALVLCALLPLSSFAWWDDAWTVRQKITLDTQAAALASEASDVPVLLRLSTGNFDFLSASDTGADLRFVAEDGTTVLPHHIERFDPTNELAFVWVRVPRLAPANATQHIWLYAGNPKAPAPAAAAPDAATWAVYHLSDESGLPQDASGAGRHVAAGTATPVPGGLIGGAARLNGDGGLQAGDAALQAATGLTWSAWIKPERADGELLSFGGLKLSLQGGVAVLQVGGAQAKSPAPLPLNAWTHVAVVHGPQAMLYLNGKPVGSVGAAFAPAGALAMGAGLVGEIDEIQVSTVARTSAWLAAQAESQGEAARLVKIGQDEGTEAAETGYFMSTLNNLTVDGWVVVVLCVIMFFVAIYVMWQKAMLLARQDKHNPAFNNAFAELTSRLRSLGGDAHVHTAQLEQLAQQAGTYQDSVLLRIYQVGARELQSRFEAAGDEHGKSGLPAIGERAMLAVRASLDAQLTRERARLDRGMVLLTIAISGGPFLGLLGTVVGVMITFAAVAAAGDVNVNAIAPGIAAALLATVAGLGVAIPALFGYNYLQTKIKGVSADMTVFVDEFVTKMAETYGD
ncbi:DUF2341 domain-containing protein [Hydrogenophaga sp.]|uniref:DUF2341 domain-containing protein n=1 Tax=Hydrogenophaga sp. TaxID=1904254 RepID=UPI00391AA8F6